MNHSEAGKLGYEKTRHVLEELGRERTKNAFEVYEANPKFCPNCGEKLPFEKRHGKFCSQSCSATYNNRGVTRHSKGPYFCECGNQRRRQNKYCDECIEKQVYSRSKAIPFEELKTDRHRKARVIAERGWQCEECGLKEWRGNPVPIEMHHIDGNTDNNDKNNLILLCLNCHGITDTYKAANKGKNSKRQQMRRQRYTEGKTW